MKERNKRWAVVLAGGEGERLRPMIEDWLGFLAMTCIMASDPSATVLVLPSDHLVYPEDRFLANVEDASHPVRRVVSFHEKPAASQAKTFFEHGYLWNTTVVAALQLTRWAVPGTLGRQARPVTRALGQRRSAS